MGRDGQLANCDPDGQKIDKARDTYGARCDAVCLEEGQLVVYKRAEKFYARVAEWRAFPLASLLTPIADSGGTAACRPRCFLPSRSTQEFFALPSHFTNEFFALASSTSTAKTA